MEPFALDFGFKCGYPDQDAAAHLMPNLSSDVQSHNIWACS